MLQHRRYFLLVRGWLAFEGRSGETKEVDMGAAIKAGIGLAVIGAVITIGWYAAGLHESPMLGLVFLAIVIPLNAIAVWWALRQTAAVNGYGKQLLSAIVVGVVAGVLIFVFSFVITSVLFPDALEDQKAAGIEWVESMGWPEEVKRKQIEGIESMTAASNAMQGMFGTMGTSLVAGLIIAAFVRRKKA
jgi:hypothetical protein